MPMTELTLGQSMSELALDGVPMFDDGFEGSISDVNDSSESTMRSKACVEMADESGLDVEDVVGGGGAALFFRGPMRVIFFINLKYYARQ